MAVRDNERSTVRCNLLGQTETTKMFNDVNNNNHLYSPKYMVDKKK